MQETKLIIFSVPWKPIITEAQLGIEEYELNNYRNHQIAYFPLELMHANLAFSPCTRIRRWSACSCTAISIALS
jgi:hypothetical protein